MPTKLTVRPTHDGDEFTYHEHFTNWLRTGTHPAVAAVEAHRDAADDWDAAHRSSAA